MLYRCFLYCSEPADRLEERGEESQDPTWQSGGWEQSLPPSAAQVEPLVEPPLEEPLVAPLAEEPTPGTSDGLSDATRRHNLDISLLARHIGRQESKTEIYSTSKQTIVYRTAVLRIRIHILFNPWIRNG